MCFAFLGWSEPPAGSSKTEPGRTDDTPVPRETAADALREVARTRAEPRNSGDGSVAGEEVEQLTHAVHPAIEARREQPSDRSGEASEEPSDEPGQVQSVQDKARPAAVPEEPPDAHAALDQAIEHACAAIAHLEASRAATRGQSAADAPDAAVSTGRPAYWAEPEIDL